MKMLMYYLKRKYNSLIRIVVTLILFLNVVACNEPAEIYLPADKKNIIESLTVYKRESCSCCKEWIKHLTENQFAIESHNHEDLNDTKIKLGLKDNRFYSCHTAVSRNGYLFEGHVPAKFIQEFLQSAPSDVLGLSVPAMPTGSPGMEFGDMFQPYKIYQINKDGSYEVFAQINTYKEQF